MRYFSIFSPYALSERISILQNDMFSCFNKKYTNMMKYSYFNLRVWNLTVLKVWQQQRLAKSLIYPHIIICSTMQKEGILVRNSYSLIHSKASKLLKRGGAQLQNLWWRCGWCSHEVCGKTVIYSRSYSWYGSSVDPKSLKKPRVGVLDSRLLITPTTEYIF